MVYEWTIPIISGTTLIVGSGLTIYVDRLERLRDASSPHPVMYRFFSQAILAMKQWPHMYVQTSTTQHEHAKQEQHAWKGMEQPWKLGNGLKMEESAWY